MNFTFYRPKNVNTTEYDNIIGKMQYDLHLLETTNTDEWSVYCYIYGISRLAKKLDKNPQMKFLGLTEPHEMPSDARVEYFYKPTYIATAFIMKSILLYPSLLNEATFLDSDLEFTVDIVKATLSSLMLGCTGRDFDGAGIYKTADCIKLFVDAGVSDFIEKYPDMCPEFTKLFLEKKKFVDEGKISASEKWYSHKN